MMTTRFWSTAPLSAIASTLRPHPILLQRLKTSDRILDFGCGQGGLVCELQQKGYRDAEGIDVNRAAIASARKQAGRISGQHANFVVGDVRSAPLETGRYDVVLSQALLTVLLDQADRKAALAEAHRLLCFNGLLYVADFCQAWHHPVYRERYRVGLRKYSDVGTFDAYGADAEHPLYTARHFTESELVDLLLETSFEILDFCYDRVHTRSGNVIYGMFFVARSRLSNE
jgi:SAM-dependent methyltransferase